MSWLFLSVICVVLGAIVLVAWRKWIAPWRHIDQLVRQIAGGEQPRTFLVDGGTLSQRVGLALENIFRHQQQLDQQIAGRESGTQTILGAMQDGLLVVDMGRHITLMNRTFENLFELRL
jgi:PAS domain-containing protein